ncbi:MAG: uroporphyrinogen-III C-methyltransferase, partial [Mycobacteriaceae bacterium]
MSRARKITPGRILFVGSGPGDPALLTVRAQHVLASTALAFVDHDVATGVTELVGTALEEPSTAEVRPAVGEPGDVAKALVAEAKAGHDVIRLVAGDPLSTDSVVAEALAVSRTSVPFEFVPGLTGATAVPSYAGIGVGSGHTVVDVRGDVNWAAVAAAPGPLVLHATAGHLAETASALVEHGLASQTPVSITNNGTTCNQRTLDATLATLNEVGAALGGPLVLTVGKVVAQRHRLSWWETRALYSWKVLVP